MMRGYALCNGGGQIWGCNPGRPCQFPKGTQAVFFAGRISDAASRDRADERAFHLLLNALHRAGADAQLACDLAHALAATQMPLDDLSPLPAALVCRGTVSLLRRARSRRTATCLRVFRGCGEDGLLNNLAS